MYQVALIPLLPGVGPTELIIVLTIILLLFGAKRIPDLAKGLGSGVREFRKGASGADEKDQVAEKKDTEIAGEAGKDTHNARMQEEAAREERAREERVREERAASERAER